MGNRCCLGDCGAEPEGSSASGSKVAVRQAVYELPASGAAQSVALPVGDALPAAPHLALCEDRDSDQPALRYPGRCGAPEEARTPPSCAGASVGCLEQLLAEATKAVEAANALHDDMEGDGNLASSDEAVSDGDVASLPSTMSDATAHSVAETLYFTRHAHTI
eukprot:TRINITY_DN5561_c0_g1_i3.p1 TRINITY_DN5561_c0_g1~~TRINITY_DN5561_c0_g1_i3.p1  ORF type:complete len:163 (+),score=15.04 TRINITY_DN5561_c0_g1_i3:40-528(+)